MTNHYIESNVVLTNNKIFSNETEGNLLEITFNLSNGERIIIGKLNTKDVRNIIETFSNKTNKEIPIILKNYSYKVEVKYLND